MIDITYLAELRHDVAIQQAQIARAQTELEATAEWKRLAKFKNTLKAYQDALTETEVNVRAVALAEYAANQDKHPHPAITIKVYEVLTYDAEQAKSYAIAHNLPKLLKLDAKVFEKAANGLGLDFVTVTEEPRATIASDLSEWVA